MGSFRRPCPLRTRGGEIRRIGVEIEFGGVALAEAVRAAFGGRVRQDHENRYTVEADLGEFEVTYDTRILSSQPSAAGDE